MLKIKQQIKIREESSENANEHERSPHYNFIGYHCSVM